MKKFYSITLKATLLSLGLFGATMSANAEVFTPGQQVTSFIEDEDNGLSTLLGTVPQFSTDDELNNWAFGSYNSANVLAYTDQRAWLGVFQVNAPAAGQYGIEVQMRTTTTNWMIGASSATGISISERVSPEAAPAWSQLARPTKISEVTKTTNLIQEADTIEGIPAIYEDVYAFTAGEWETIYIPVELTEGTNYVTFWLCRTYSGIDALKGPEGSINGVYVKGIKVMPQGSGEVAAALQTATLKLWQQRMYPAMNVESGADLAPAYASLLAAYGTATDYASLSIADVQNGIEAVAEREQDLRHGQGAIVDGDSAIFALPYYHDLKGGAISENERGEYSDAPMVFEYTNGKTLVYKFTTTISGNFYPELYEGSQLSTNAHLIVYADDSTTVVMPEWIMPANSGAWQVYQMNSNPVLAKFQAEAGKTYFLTIYFENYVNVRGLYMRQIVQKGKTYAELEALVAEGQDLYAEYQPGTERFNAIGGRMELIQALSDALDAASDLDENSTSAEITAVYYQLDDAIGQLKNAPIMNVIPNTETNPFDIANGIFTSWRMENGGNIGYAYGNGSVAYDVYSTVDQKYDLAFTCSAPGTGAQVAIYMDAIREQGDTVRYFEKIVDIEQSGGWANWDMPEANYTVEGVPAPLGRVIFTVFGYQAGSNGFVGNFNLFRFTGVEGTEGAGSAAVAEAAGIENIQSDITSDAIFNLNGIMVGNDPAKMGQGIFIIRGKKVMVK